MAKTARQNRRLRSLALAAGVFALIAAVGAMRLAVLGAAPITDPLEARELQLAQILVERGWGAFGQALAPQEIGRAAAALPVALSGWLAGGFAELLPLRLPGFIAVLLATFGAFRVVLRLTGRRGSALIAAAAFYAAPGTGLLGLSSTADALTLLCLVAATASLANLLRWGGDSRAAPGTDLVLYLPPGDRRAGRLADRSSPEIASRALRRAATADRASAVTLWVACALGVWVAGAALPAFAAVAALLSGALFRLRLIHDPGILPRWAPASLRPAFAPAAVLVALVPAAIYLVLAVEPRITDLAAGYLVPRPDVSAYAAAPLGSRWSLLLLVWPLLALLPLWLLSRVYFGAARETLVVGMIGGWAVLWSMLPGGQGLALVFGGTALAIGAGLLANYAAELAIRPALATPPGPASDLLPPVSAGLMGGGGVALVALMYDAASASDLALVLLLAAILMLLPLAWSAIEQSLPGLCLAGLAIAALLEAAGTGFLMPRAHDLWPGGKVAAILAPFRACGGAAIHDETGFDTGFLHHAGSGATAPGMAPPPRPALVIRAGEGGAGPLVARIGHASPRGGEAVVWVRADPAASRGRWRDCVDLLSLP